jgi:hypothetical protein
MIRSIYIFTQLLVMTRMNGVRTRTDDIENTPDAVKNTTVGKFEPKVLVWCAISEAGVSTPFIGTV